MGNGESKENVNIQVVEGKNRKKNKKDQAETTATIRNAVSIVKVTRPKVSGVIQRKRLYKLIDTCRESSLVWLSAPAGAGKTTLVADYLTDRKLPCIWYRMDEGDADIATFFYYMGIAAKKAVPRKHHSLPALTTEYLLGIAAFTARYFENLYTRLTIPYVLVFDDYQRVPQQSGLHEVIRRGVEILPEGLNVIIISRDSPHPAFARFLINRSLRQLGPYEIGFNLEELGKMLASRGVASIDDEVLRRIYERTRGWAAAIMLMTEKSLLKRFGEQYCDLQAPQEIFDYFASEVFATTEPVIRDFLQRTAFVPRMTVLTAERLSGNVRAGDILSRLHRGHYFTEKNTQAEPVYQYHPLFREFLISRATETLSPHELTEIQLKAAALLMKEGQIEDCAALLRDAEEWDGLVRLILGNACQLVSHGRSRTLEEWIDALPDEIRENAPWLLYWKAICISSFKVAEGRPFFLRAFRIFEKEGDDLGTLQVWSAIIDAYMIEFGCTKELDPWIAWLDGRVRTGLSFPSSEIEINVVSSMTAALAWRMPNHPDIGKWLERMSSQMQRIPDANCFYRYASIAAYYLFLGRCAECSMMVEIMKKQETASPLLKIILKLAETTAYSSSFESLDKALQAFSEGRKLAENTGVHVLDMAYFCMGMLPIMFSGNMKMAGELLSEFECTQGLPLLQASQVSFFSSWYHLVTGNVSRALVLAKYAAETAETPGHVIYQAFAALLLAELIHEAGNYPEADGQLAVAGDIALRTGSPACIFMYHMMEACFAFDRKDYRAGFDSLRKAMTLGRETGYSAYLFMWRKDVFCRMCVKALEAGIETEFVKSIIRKNGFTHEMVPIEIVDWPWPVRIITLGKFDVVLGGDSVRFTGKVQKKPLLLLKVLIALGGRDVREVQLTDLLWPDVDGDQAYSAFTTTAMRLRRLLGQDDALSVHRGAVSLNSRHCWVDTWAFEAMAERADAGLKGLFEELGKGKHGEGEILETLDKAVRLYGGPFLSEEGNQSWLLPLRGRLRRKLTHLVVGFGSNLEAADQWENAVEYYNRALEMDEITDEEIYLRLMICHCRLGRPARAVEVYRWCRKALAMGLGIRPSTKIEAIYQDLLA